MQAIIYLLTPIAFRNSIFYLYKQSELLKRLHEPSK